MPMTAASPSEKPLALLSALAPEFGAQVADIGRHWLMLEVAVPMPDGVEWHFSIRAEAYGPIVGAREESPRLLPPSCPERHINPDGSFCLGWDEVDRIEVDSEERAFEWWARLVNFLRLQVRAARLHRWPSRRAWAHGDAARHQHAAMLAAAKLGPWMTEALDAGQVAVSECTGGSNGPALRVTITGRRLFDVWCRHRRVVNMRGPCVCLLPRGARRKVFKSCADHASAAADLALSLQSWRAAEQRFWASMADAPCCGTMDDCPLAKAA